MSGRSYKKYLKKQNQQITTSNSSESETESTDGDELVIKKPERQNIFSLLMNENEDDAEAEVEAEAEESDTEKSTKDPDLVPVPSTQEPLSKGKKQRRPKKGPKKRQSPRASSSMDQLDAIDDDLEEITKAIGEISSSSPKHMGTESEEAFGDFCPSPYLKAAAALRENSLHYQKDTLNVFAVNDNRLFNLENELRRLFGSKLVSQSSGPGVNASRTGGNRRNMFRKSIFANPNDHWPPYVNCGISMELSERKDDAIKFQICHTSSYAQVQKNFLDFMSMHDPNLIGQLLQTNPYHVDSLLVMSEVLKQSGDITNAGILVQRALYAFERSFHSMFNVSNGSCQLSYCRIENRGFYVTLFRHIQYVARKGCWRTAFETSRFLLSLDPSNDPLAVLLVIDFYGLQGDQHVSLLDLYQTLRWRKRLDLLPNWSYSIALCYWKAGRKSDALEQLVKAIIMFPAVIKGIIDGSSHAIPAKLSNHPYLQNHGNGNENNAAIDGVGDSDASGKGLNVLERMYILQSLSLWKAVSLQSFLEEGLEKALEKVDEKDISVGTAISFRREQFSSIPQNIYRHALMSDLPQLNVSIPPEFLVGRRGIHMHDPLPPINAEQSIYDSYLEERENTAYQTRSLQGNPLYLLLESLIPGWTPEQAMQLDNDPNNHNSVSRIVSLLRQNAANLFGNAAADEDDEDIFDQDDDWENPDNQQQ